MTAHHPAAGDREAGTSPSDYAVCLDQAVEGSWRWRLIDLQGAPAASGAEPTQQDALQAAVSAAQEIGGA